MSDFKRIASPPSKVKIQEDEQKVKLLNQRFDTQEEIAYFRAALWSNGAATAIISLLIVIISTLLVLYFEVATVLLYKNYLVLSYIELWIIIITMAFFLGLVSADTIYIQRFMLLRSQKISAQLKLDSINRLIESNELVLNKRMGGIQRGIA